MSLVIDPERDAPVDNMKLHKDLSWVIRAISALVVVGFVAGVWATTLASDVQKNTEKLEEKASSQQVEALARTLSRIEGKIDGAATEQRVIRDSVIRLETKVQKLEEDSGR